MLASLFDELADLSHGSISGVDDGLIHVHTIAGYDDLTAWDTDDEFDSGRSAISEELEKDTNGMDASPLATKLCGLLHSKLAQGTGN